MNTKAKAIVAVAAGTIFAFTSAQVLAISAGDPDPEVTVATSPLKPVWGPSGDDARHALDLISQVHATPSDLPVAQITVDELDGPEGTFETNYIPNPDGTETRVQWITLDNETSSPVLTTLHEVGHYFDSNWLGVGLGVQSRDSDVKALRSALRDTDSYRELVRCSQGRSAHRTDEGYVEWCEYAKAPHEVFARAYAQYISMEVGGTRVLSTLESRGTPMQWTLEDFAPIVPLMHAVLTEGSSK